MTNEDKESLGGCFELIPGVIVWIAIILCTIQTISWIDYRLRKIETGMHIKSLPLDLTRNYSKP